MQQLQDILKGVQVLSSQGILEVQVQSITFDSRKVGEGVLFVAMRGVQADGHEFIPKAEEAKAVAIVCEELPAQLQPGITYVQVKNSGEALGQMASAFYGHPSKKLQLVGVTGTNGKTTSVTLLHKLFRELGYHVGLLSTVQNQIDEEIIPSTHTTPDAVRLNELLAQMVKAGCTHCFMEVSSHAMVQQRVAGLTFAGGVFTNITHDHLDYHGSFDEYIKAKKSFFDMLPKSAFALINADDKRGPVMVQNTKAAVHYYALRKVVDFKARIIDNTIQGLHLEVDGQEIWCKLIGAFNAYNLLGAYGVAVLLGEDKIEALTVLSSLDSAAGRFDYLVSDALITGIVDYAHTPDALENVLNTIQQIRNPNQKVITLVGCGGNRDAAKRPLMADIACRLSDKVILTSDNPRFEEPQAILEDMQKGVKPLDFKKTLSVLDRREAIKTACMLAEPNDIILVAGKGHETYQEVKGVKHDFDDKQVLREMFQQLGK
ncbi:UDP-N-acetylmuramoyl-L-alanyl-D-glutamate--2,6-diaminopimelate ligase [Pontibacter akesuensis]|uniref:UDP-N-acetylmuramoyl-L-alanyl-D-glutamate--2,6-diaminopimelate ligase n=1 Tax=Pontibacter akesuensis TaxID=388950 RepID=A0A1I7GXM7_9BACT|nr:UDP-N-acetylmuramoyl-L-alanyl-D-glutamate--2,6-diaminopimelate ligase [Pontibacter akesuensis]GHA54568.1 UDP-N-acetylmuramoyl-L-alanyl-D-glutamate--2,6-diaminopimelate ligase [Pontibacter akesuensis]SFU53183.1 UDP-N-acetylmuramoylalanyl-D-glutamate--2,6-diaminopimelate ligase [Pontibacter akesuensis]